MAQPVFCLVCIAVTDGASSKELGTRPRTLLRGTVPAQAWPSAVFHSPLLKPHYQACLQAASGLRRELKMREAPQLRGLAVGSSLLLAQNQSCSDLSTASAPTATVSRGLQWSPFSLSSKLPSPGVGMQILTQQVL